METIRLRTTSVGDAAVIQLRIPHCSFKCDLRLSAVSMVQVREEVSLVADHLRFKLHFLLKMKRRLFVI